MLIAALARAQQTSFQVQAQLARVELRAVQADGAALDGLLSSHLSLRENGVELPVHHLSREELDLDILLLVDTSFSMATSARRLAADVHVALAATRPSDRLALMTFDRKRRLWCPLTSDRDQFTAALNQAFGPRGFHAGTVIYSAALDAAKQLQRTSAPERRRAIIMLTDGMGFKGASLAETQSALWEADVSLHALLIDHSKKNGLPWGAKVEDLTTATAGELMKAKIEAPALAQLFAVLRKRYTAYYVPSTTTSTTMQSRDVVVTLNTTGQNAFPTAKVLGRRRIPQSSLPQ